MSIHHGGGVGMRFSQHSGMVVVCDGTPDTDGRPARVLTDDPGTSVIRNADAGYPEASRARGGRGWTCRGWGEDGRPACRTHLPSSLR